MTVCCKVVTNFSSIYLNQCNVIVSAGCPKIINTAASTVFTGGRIAADNRVLSDVYFSGLVVAVSVENSSTAAAIGSRCIVSDYSTVNIGNRSVDSRGIAR
jgi:hypothetical protein